MSGKIPLDAVIWDMDGTLVYFKIDFASARRATIAFLEAEGVPRGTLTVDVPIFEQVELARDYFLGAGRGEEYLRQLVARVDALVQEFERKATEETRAVEGIVDVLEFCRESGLVQAVWTLNHTEIAEFTLKRVGIREYFDEVVGRDSVARPKPDTSHLQEVLDRLGLVDPGRVLVVGDHPHDIEGGIRVGTRTMAVQTTRHPASEFTHAEDVVPQGSIRTIVSTLKDKYILPRQPRAKYKSN
ncbi:MAG: HAD family hydrolase [Promethearchaeota archaeon]